MKPVRAVRKVLFDPKIALRYGVIQGSRALGKRFDYGVLPFDKQWDVMIVLDACMYTLFEETAPAHPVYNSFDDVSSVYSCGSSTLEWIKKTLDGASEEAIAQTHYVAGNPRFFRERLDGKIDPSGLGSFEEVFQYGYDPELKTVDPAAVTNATVRAFRDNPDRRYLVHYVQPHAPFLHCPHKYGGDFDGTPGNDDPLPTPWHGIKNGTFEKSEVWADYAQNLSLVLDHVETLIENLRGDIVVTADHGNFFDYLGLDIYQHPSYMFAPAVKRVPWATATGEGEDTYDVVPNSAITDSEEGFQVDAVCERVKQSDDSLDEEHREQMDEMLRNLGYK